LWFFMCGDLEFLHMKLKRVLTVFVFRLKSCTKERDTVLQILQFFSLF
jgi:hypothetical protein